MSTAQNSREIAYRLLATEFEDATLSYSSGDDERAPNYVVTPTGGRINRLFAVGALTAVESVTDNLRRGRIADPTGVFVTYAGQYQPAAANFLEQATPPMFVALTGKARTYQPEDSDEVLTSARPEGLTAVDTDTRDRWVVGAAEATLRRIAMMDAAQSLSLRGNALQDELESRGVDEARAEGTALAIEHYGTTEFYLESLRRVAIQVLELVAGDRETVETTEPGPSETGDANLGALPSIAIDTTPAPTGTTAGIQDTEIDASASVDDDNIAADTTSSAEPSPSQELDVDTDIVQPAADGESKPESIDEPDEYSTPDPISAEDDAESGVATANTGHETEGDGSLSDFPEDSGLDDEMVDTVDDLADETDSIETQLDDEIQREVDESDISINTNDVSESESEPNSTSTPDITSAGEGVASGDSDDSSTIGSADAEGDMTADPTEMYEFDDDERAEIEDEFGTEFSTGNEIDAPGSADIDVPTAPDMDPSDEKTSVDVSADATDTDASGVDSLDASTESNIDADTNRNTNTDTGIDDPTDDISAENTVTSGSLGDFETDFDSDSDPAASTDRNLSEAETESNVNDNATTGDTTDSNETQDVDLEQAAVSMMSELDDGDGATRDAVIGAVVDRHNVSPNAVESAIQSALMSGRCYESGEDALKAI